METDGLTEIYINLPDEDTTRAVQARKIRGNLYQIVSENTEDERWEFSTGDKVRCMRHRFVDGEINLLAYKKVEDDVTELKLAQ